MRRGSKTGPKAKILLLILVLVGATMLVLSAFGFGPDPEVEITADRPGIGPETEVTVHVAEPRRGVDAVRVALLQGDREEVLAEEAFEPRPIWKLWSADHTPETILRFRVGKRHQPWLVDGEATVRVEATRPGGWFRTPEAVVAESALPVRVSPPRLSVLSSRTYVSQGGAEAVVYQVEETIGHHGVQTPDIFFPGFEVPGRPGEYFALFSVPWDLPTADGVVLVAEDELGNRAERSFIDRFSPKPVSTSVIRLNDRFLEKVRSEMSSRFPEVAEAETPLAAYLWVNGPLRERNRERLHEIAGQSRTDFLWNEPFLALPGGQVMDSFAVRRTYLYEGEPVDEQTHLGYDLASTQRAEVPAANDGVVLLAEYFGIYGNCIIVDHGFGLTSLYAHLSSMHVSQGEPVTRGQVLGRTGDTGLAGGDHLHFATLLRGLPVNALEWWDSHWIQDRLAGKLGEALPFARDGS